METSRTTGSGGEHASSDVGSSAGADVTHTQRLCQTCVEVLDVDGAAVAVMGGAQAREVVFATDAVVQQLDELQFTLGEGPCVDAFRTREPVQVVDLDSDQAMERWSGGPALRARPRWQVLDRSSRFRCRSAGCASESSNSTVALPAP